MALTDMHIVVRSLRHRLFSTITTISMVAVAVALLLTLFTLRESAARAFSRGTGNMHVLVAADDSPLAAVLNSVFYARAPRRPLTMALYEKIAADQRLSWAIPVQHGDNLRGYPSIATTPEIFTKFQPVAGEPWRFAAGTGFSAGNDTPSAVWELVIGANVAKGTGLGVGSTVTLTHGTDQRGMVHTDTPFTVIGVLEPTGSPHDRAVFMRLDATWIMHARDTRKASGNAVEPMVENLTERERLITGIFLRAKTREGAELSPAVGMVYDELRRDVRLTVARPSEEVGNLMRIVGNIDLIVLVIAWVVLFSSAISVMLVMYESVEQRRRQIAILRVLGAGPGRVALLVLTESAVIGLLGAACGVLLLLVAGPVAAGIVQSNLGLVLSVAINPRDAASVVLGTLALCMVAGLVPALMGYRTDVVRQLRPQG